MRVYQWQSCVESWARACFPGTYVDNKEERVFRFTEEAIELAQAGGASKEDVLKLVDYVYDRPVGNVHQEVGGVMTTLGILCSIFDIDMEQASRRELARITEPATMDVIRRKQANKVHGNGPLPGVAE